MVRKVDVRRPILIKTGQILSALLIFSVPWIWGPDGWGPHYDLPTADSSICEAHRLLTQVLWTQWCTVWLAFAEVTHGGSETPC